MTGAFLLACRVSTYKMYYVNYALGILVDNSVIHFGSRTASALTRRTLASMARSANNLEEL